MSFDEYRKTVGIIIGRERRFKRFSVDRLAAIAGISPDRMRAIESGAADVYLSELWAFGCALDRVPMLLISHEKPKATWPEYPEPEVMEPIFERARAYVCRQKISKSKLAKYLSDVGAPDSGRLSEMILGNCPCSIDELRAISTALGQLETLELETPKGRQS